MAKKKKKAAKKKAKRKPAKKVAAVDTKPKRPNNWEKIVMAAYMLALGATHAEAAKTAGCSSRAIRDWNKKEWWEDAKREGVERWQSEIVALTRKGIKQALKDPDEYAATSKYVADRMISELAPPKIRQDVNVSHEGWLDELDKPETSED